MVTAYATADIQGAVVTEESVIIELEAAACGLVPTPDVPTGMEVVPAITGR